MRNKTTSLNLFCAALLLSPSEAWALPNCPDDPNAVWSNCYGSSTHADGNKYVGEWKDNQANGLGTYTFGSGSKWFGDEYIGAFKNDMFHGQGTRVNADGSKYVGEWKDNKPHGQGTHMWPDGEKYAGEWRGGKYHGQGTYTYAGGEKYVGEYNDGKRNGQGTHVWPTGEKYVGEYKDGEKHGQGTYTYADGTIEEGIWENDQFQYAKIAQPPGLTEVTLQGEDDGEKELEAARLRFLSLDYPSRLRIQEWLALNYEYKSAVDGLWGPSTKMSLSRALRRLPNAQTAFTVALMEVPQNAQTNEPRVVAETKNSEAVSQEHYVAQLLLACSISPAGSLGERLADAQLFAATGQRCSKPSPSAPLMPAMPGVAPSQSPSMNCQLRSKPQLYRIPGMHYPPTWECW